MGKMNKALVGAVMLGIAATSQARSITSGVVAGAVTGAVVGSMVASSNAAANASTTSASGIPPGAVKMVIGRTIIQCEVFDNKCYTYGTPNKPLMEYVSWLGFRKVHNQYWYIKSNGRPVIYLEVSK